MHLSLRFNAAHPTLKATTAGSSDSSMDFDVVLVGSSMTRTVTLHTEALPVVVQGIAVAPLPSADSQAPGRTAKEASPRSASLRTAKPHTMFAVAAPQLPLTLPAYGSITIPVTFSATAVVARFTTALVVEWDGGQPLQVPVAAAGDRFEMLWRVAPLRERSGVDTLRASMAEVRGEGAVLLQRMYAAFRTVIPQPASGLQRPTTWKRYPEDDDTIAREEDDGATAAVDDVLPDPSTPSPVVSFGVVQVREGDMCWLCVSTNSTLCFVCVCCAFLGSLGSRGGSPSSLSTGVSLRCPSPSPRTRQPSNYVKVCPPTQCPSGGRRATMKLS